MLLMLYSENIIAMVSIHHELDSKIQYTGSVPHNFVERTRQVGRWVG